MALESSHWPISISHVYCVPCGKVLLIHKAKGPMRYRRVLKIPFCGFFCWWDGRIFSWFDIFCLPIWNAPF